jgi:hypothetical protein
LHVENIKDTSFPRDQIEESLRRQFRRAYTRDRERQRPSPASGRLHFIARK